MTTPFIGATSALCAVGRGADQAWASVRAGIGRIGNSHVMDRHFDPIQMGLVPEEELPPLAPEFDALGLPSQARRMLRLTAAALGPVTAGLKAPVRLFIGLPKPGAGATPWLSNFLACLWKIGPTPIDSARSTVIPRGRASALLALEAALQAVTADPSGPVVVGGVDTFLDLRLLANLDAEQRILGPRSMEGFIPGEGAAFFILHPASSAAPRAASVVGAASSVDAGHRYGTAPALGEGLAEALNALRTSLTQPAPPVATTFAGFNGENFDAKLWGVARMRHSDFFAPAMLMEHPADKYGDAGAATGALLTVLAATALSRGQRPGPALVWAASDEELRACALLATAK